jgi:selenocysteine lyase/cysteine desulfurase
VAVAHASNVTGLLQPVEAIAELAHRRGALVLVDAAQTLGHLPLDVRELGADLLAASGHKGLLGPLGTGVLCVAPGVDEALDSVRQGGTGSQSQSDRQPDELPDKYEPGNLNVPGLAGLEAAVRYLHQRGLDAIRRHELELTAQLLDELAGIDGVEIYGAGPAEARVGVVSITLSGTEPQDVAAMLEASYRVQVRAGLHCAPLMHQSLGTLSRGGTVRLSLGPFNTPDDVGTAAGGVREIAAAALSF